MKRPLPGRPRRLLVPVALLGGGLLAAACSGGTSAVPSTTSSTLPPLPPAVIAYVTLVGSGSQAGLGTRVVPVNVTAAPASTSAAIQVGTFPDAIAITPDQKTAYVANYGSNDVTPDRPRHRARRPADPGGLGSGRYRHHP